jgi:hypothetical protein
MTAVTAVTTPRFFFVSLNAENTFWPDCNICIKALMQEFHYGLNASLIPWPI